MNFLPRDAGRIHWHHDQRFVLVRCALRGVHQQAAPVGLHAVGNPHLAAIDDEIIAVASRVGFDRRHVRATTDFADADAADHIPGDCRGEKIALEFIRAKAGQRWRAHVGLHTYGHRYAAAIAIAERFGHYHRVRKVQPKAAVGFGIFHAQQTQIAHFLEHFMGRKLFCFFPCLNMRIDFFLDEALYSFGKLLVFGGEKHSASFREY